MQYRSLPSSVECSRWGSSVLQGQSDDPFSADASPPQPSQPHSCSQTRGPLTTNTHTHTHTYTHTHTHTHTHIHTLTQTQTLAVSSHTGMHPPSHARQTSSSSSSSSSFSSSSSCHINLPAPGWTRGDSGLTGHEKRKKEYSECLVHSHHSYS